jgi:hypothetical protein
MAWTLTVTRSSASPFLASVGLPRQRPPINAFGISAIICQHFRSLSTEINIGIRKVRFASLD